MKAVQKKIEDYDSGRDGKWQGPEDAANNCTPGTEGCFNVPQESANNAPTGDLGAASYQQY